MNDPVFRAALKRGRLICKACGPHMTFRLALSIYRQLRKGGGFVFIPAHEEPVGFHPDGKVSLAIRRGHPTSRL